MSKDIVIILGFALIVVAGWISIDLYKSVAEAGTPVVTEEFLKPIDPELDFEVLNDLKLRVDTN